MKRLFPSNEDWGWREAVIIVLCFPLAPILCGVIMGRMMYVGCLGLAQAVASGWRKLSEDDEDDWESEQDDLAEDDPFIQ